MRTTLAVAALMASAMMLSGCAIPIGVQIAKLSLDGISYITTQKSLTDHGISLVTGEDCAMHRILTRGAMCSQWQKNQTITVDLKIAPGTAAAIPPLTASPAAGAVAEFETAAGRPADTAPAPSVAPPVQPSRSSIESRLEQKGPPVEEVRAEPRNQTTIAVPESAGLVLLWDGTSETKSAPAAEFAKADDVTTLVGSGPKVTKRSGPLAAVADTPQSTRVLMLWEILKRGGIVPALARQKAFEAIEAPRPQDVPARPAPT